MPEGMKRRGADRNSFCSLPTRKNYIEQLLCVYQRMYMSVFMEKNIVGERSPHLCRAEGLQLKAQSLPLGQSLFPTLRFIRAPTHKFPAQQGVTR